MAFDSRVADLVKSILDDSGHTTTVGRDLEKNEAGTLPKWSLSSGRGDHQPSTCRAAKRWLAEGGDPETYAARQLGFRSR